MTVEATRSLRQAVLRPHMTVDEMAESEPAEAFAAGAFAELDDSPAAQSSEAGCRARGRREQLIAVGLIGPEGEPGGWRVRGMATAPEWRGRGAGSAVLDALLGYARERGGTYVWASVRVPARTLYERAGMRVASEEFELPHIGPHVIMRMELAGEGG